MEELIQAAANNFGWVLFVSLLVVWAVCDMVLNSIQLYKRYKKGDK